MQKYRKKPVIIEAIEYTGKNADEIAKWMNSGNSPVTHKTALTIFTLEGNLIASIGDYIIKGVKGEFYPCKPDIFEETYEEVK